MSIYRRRLMIANTRKEDIPDLSNYPGLIAAWSAAGKSNDDADRDVLRDLTGNGHDITLNNFAFSEMSGYGGYNINFDNWIFDESRCSYEKISKNKFILTQIKVSHAGFVYQKINMDCSIKLYVEGITDEKITFGNPAAGYVYLINGLNDFSEFKGYFGGYSSFRSDTIVDSCNITIELLPEYPDALVFDGVDDYGINEGMPILTDYTIIVKRKNFEIPSSQSYLITKSKDFAECIIVENIRRSTNNMFLVNFGKYSTVPLYTENITFQTKSQYNNNRIQAGTTEDGNNFLIGARLSYNSKFCGAFYSAYLFDRSLDEQEIKAFVRKYIDADYVLPSEQTTE